MRFCDSVYIFICRGTTRKDIEETGIITTKRISCYIGKVTNPIFQHIFNEGLNTVLWFLPFPSLFRSETIIQAFQVRNNLAGGSSIYISKDVTVKITFSLKMI